MPKIKESYKVILLSLFFLVTSYLLFYIYSLESTFVEVPVYRDSNSIIRKPYLDRVTSINNGYVFFTKNDNDTYDNIDDIVKKSARDKHLLINKVDMSYIEKKLLKAYKLDKMPLLVETNKNKVVRSLNIEYDDLNDLSKIENSINDFLDASPFTASFPKASIIAIILNILTLVLLSYTIVYGFKYKSLILSTIILVFNIITCYNSVIYKNKYWLNCEYYSYLNYIDRVDFVNLLILLIILCMSIHSILLGNKNTYIVKS